MNDIEPGRMVRIRVPRPQGDSRRDLRERQGLVTAVTNGVAIVKVYEPSPLNQTVYNVPLDQCQLLFPTRWSPNTTASKGSSCSPSSSAGSAESQRTRSSPGK